MKNLIFLIPIALILFSCGTGNQPLPDIEATVEARLAEERSLEATVEAKAHTMAKAIVQATAEAAPPKPAIPSTFSSTPTPLLDIPSAVDLMEAVQVNMKSLDSFLYDIVVTFGSQTGNLDGRFTAPDSLYQTMHGPEGIDTVRAIKIKNEYFVKDPERGWHTQDYFEGVDIRELWLEEHRLFDPFFLYPPTKVELNGVNAYKIDMSLQDELGGPSSQKILSFFEMEEDVPNDLSVQYWLEADTFLLSRVLFLIEVEIDDMDRQMFDIEGDTAVMSFDFLISHYNEQVDQIVAPIIIPTPTLTPTIVEVVVEVVKEVVATPTAPPTSTPVPPTVTPTPTPPPTFTPIPTATPLPPTATPTATATQTSTPTPTATPLPPTATPTATATQTPTPTPTATPTATATQTSTPTPTATPALPVVMELSDIINSIISVNGIPSELKGEFVQLTERIGWENIKEDRFKITPKTRDYVDGAWCLINKDQKHLLAEWKSSKTLDHSFRTNQPEYLNGTKVTIQGNIKDDKPRPEAVIPYKNYLTEGLIIEKKIAVLTNRGTVYQRGTTFEVDSCEVVSIEDNPVVLDEHGRYVTP